jgi:YegS/Rv2252/BmrU family lipid kinase
MKKDTWIVLLNPNAGTRKGVKDWDKIRYHLEESKIIYKHITTEKKEHAVSITKTKIIEGYRKFLVVGGDGTLNEVINGIFTQDQVTPDEFLVGMIPVGTGNDWCRMFKVPFSYKKAVKTLLHKKTFVQDIGKVTYFEGNHQKSRYFINVAGIGYDAVVASKTNKDKSRGRGGPLVYIKNLFTSLLFYKPSDTVLKIDNQEPYSCKTFSMGVGICKYNGGGMKQLPDAIPDDGLLDVTLIKNLGKFTVIKEISRLYDGSFVNHPKVATFTGKKISIKSKPAISLEADGESLGHSPFEFEIMPKILRVVVGKDYGKLSP